MGSRAAKSHSGQRVRVDQDDEPYPLIGKLGIVETINAVAGLEPSYSVKVDHLPEPLEFLESHLAAVTVVPSSLLANDLFLPWDMDDPRPRVDSFTKKNWLAGHVLETLLFYENVVIPTVDFSIVVPLVHWLGSPLFIELLTSGALSFVRYRGGLGYAGNGNGINLFEIRPGDNTEDVWWVRSARSEIADAVQLQLENRLKGLSAKEVMGISEMMRICTVETSFPQFQSRVAEESYRDIVASDPLRALIGSQLDTEKVLLTKLPGVGPDQMRVFSRLGSPAVNGDPVDITLRVAMLNLEVYMSEEAGTRDMVTDRGIGLLLGGKFNRASSGAGANDNFSKLVEVAGVPDIEKTVNGGQIDAAELWRFRESGSARKFREWFDQYGPSENDLLKEYIARVQEAGFLSTGPIKTIRYLVLLAAGVASIVEPVSGSAASMALSAADAFLIDKIRLGFNPRYFIDDLNHHFFSG